VNNCFRSLHTFGKKYIYWCRALEEVDEVKCKFYRRGRKLNGLTCIYRSGAECDSSDAHLSEDAEKKMDEL